MTAEAVLQSLGLSEMLSRDVLGVQLAVLAATAALFVFSLAMMIMAARSAGGALKARREAESYLRHAQDVIVEARQLSAQIERAAARSKDNNAAPVRVSARETTPEADVEVIGLNKSNAVSTRNLDAAREASTVPKGLLGRSPRR